MLAVVKKFRGFARAVPFVVVAAALALASPAVAQVQFRFRGVQREVIEQRLRGFLPKDSERLALLREWFAASGCAAENLSEQPVKHVALPNLICVLPGATDSVIVVGAHFDHVNRGAGVVDNWSGASLLPSLLESLSGSPRQHTYVFIAFTAEEQGLVGSEFYVKQLTREQRAKIAAMVNLDTLGLGPAEVWVNGSDRNLVKAMLLVAKTMKLPLTGMNVDQVGSTDSESFARRKIPVIAVHSITQNTFRFLHSSDDRLSAIRLDDYLETYRLVAGYLAFLDQHLELPAAQPAVAGKN